MAIWLRVVIYGLVLALVLGAVSLPRTPAKANDLAPAPTRVPTAPPQPGAPPLMAAPLALNGNLLRLAELHTIIPERPSYTIQDYAVQPKDSLFSIAAKFKLKPDTILWGNPELAENPNVLSVGRTLKILPVDGALRTVMTGDTLEKIAKVFHSTIEEIISYPGNNLDAVNPQISIGQALVIPNGWREMVVWQLPAPVNRNVSGRTWSPEPGACPGPFSGPSGTFAFVWPAANHFLSGWDYKADHLGIDIAAGTGAPIYASDTGVIVFAGQSTWGYGNLVIIDHGNGWQTAYAHLSQINVVCGQGIYQGQILGLAGNTGRSYGAHLHFEMRNSDYGRVSPWLYLP